MLFFGHEKLCLEMNLIRAANLDEGEDFRDFGSTKFGQPFSFFWMRLKICARIYVSDGFCDSQGYLLGYPELSNQFTRLAMFSNPIQILICPP